MRRILRFAVLISASLCLAQQGELFEAVRQGDLARLKALIAGKPDVNLRGLHGRTVLHEAAANCQFEAARLLLDSGWDRLARDDQGSIPAAFALECRNLGVADLRFVLSRLVDSTLPGGAPPGRPFKSEQNPWTLQHAAKHGRTNVVSMLLAMGADVNETSPEGNRALDLSCLKGDAAISRVLLERSESEPAQPGWFYPAARCRPER
jgi:ankyrin repeat protein